MGARCHRPRLIFLHIPKTAGTSVDQILRSGFDADEICPERLSGIGLWPPEQIAQFRYFSMHGSYQSLSCISPPWRSFTILREPIDRLLSQYLYWRSHAPAHVERNNIVMSRLARAYDLKAFLRCPVPQLLPKIDNVMTRYLSDETFAPDGSLWRSDDQMLEVALRNLDAINACALYEFLPTSLDLACRTLDLPPPRTLHHANATRENHVTDASSFVRAEDLLIDDEAEDLLVQRNRLDTIVYAAARQRLFRHLGPQSRVVTGVVPADVRMQPRYVGTTAHPGQGRPRYVLFGPYVRLKKGRYRLRFGLSTAGSPELPPPTAMAQLDVCSRAGTHVHAVRTITSGELAGEMRSFELTFTLDRTEPDLEFRIFHCGLCDLALESTTILDDGPAIAG